MANMPCFWRHWGPHRGEVPANGPGSALTSLVKIRQPDFVKVVTATEASRSFAVVLEEAERGEMIVVTRGEGGGGSR
ncbi:hypothetical protein GCM10022252_45850 [Streptosporangium oxazolinicum]|uniref:Uncharacterized protein n=1 Tax=Streptosporangium oxazolinicum TaxID=909287 RepID=A0ABP8B3P2_9ACTN